MDRKSVYLSLGIVLIFVHVFLIWFGIGKTLLQVDVVLILVLLFYNLILIRKLRNKEWEKLEVVMHFTTKKGIKLIKQKDGSVYIKRSKNPLANIEFLFRRPIYFFPSEPSEEVFERNLPGKDFCKRITIPIKNIEREKLRLRVRDGALLYLKDYKGPAEITDKEMPTNNDKKNKQ